MRNRYQPGIKVCFGYEWFLRDCLTFGAMDYSGKAWIGMGSNSGNRLELLQSALDLMAANGIALLKVSHVYETEPVGFVADTHFMNLVAEVAWPGTHLALLEILMKIENQLGRTRNGLQRYESRTMDLDILLFSQEVINSASLVIPHPRMAERRFVLEPLNELIPSYIHPVLKAPISELLESCIDKNGSFVRLKPLYINH
jgi:2-amino-4-hydroxy-6-hydroxymethyldihydropteridine diphosphokinase